MFLEDVLLQREVFSVFTRFNVVAVGCIESVIHAHGLSD